MTVSSSNTAELSINQLVRQALVAVGMMAPEQSMSGSQWNSRAAVGREHLQLILGSVQGKRFLVRQVENYTVTIAAGDGAEATPIVLPEDTLDVLGDGMWAEPGQTTEFPVKQVDRGRWHTYPDKASTSRPWAMYVEKLGALRVFLLQPAGADQAGAVLRLQRQKLLANMVQAGGNTPDLERSWHPYLVWKLAAFFATGTLPAQAAIAMENARQALQDALPANGPQLGQRIRFGRWC